MGGSEILGYWIVVTGLDGAGKSTLVQRLAQTFGAQSFRLPFHEFVGSCLNRSGDGLPFGDVHTDRLLFALDARLANYQIRQWRREGTAMVSQRGWMDNFIFGAVQKVSYAETDQLLRAAELERATAHVFLVADPVIAFKRVARDPRRDKYESSDFLAQQYRETLEFFEEVQRSNFALAAFSGIPAVLIDTTIKTSDEIYAAACEFLAGNVAGCSRSLPALVADYGRERVPLVTGKN
jgi:thymidylate kinase